jgi:hypothetical protein
MCMLVSVYIVWKGWGVKVSNVYVSECLYSVEGVGG